MDIKQLNEAITKALNEKNLTKPKKYLKENVVYMDDVVEEIVSRYEKADSNDIGDIDEWINDELQDTFSYMDDVIDMYKEIAIYDDNLYNEVSDAVWNSLHGMIRDRID